MQDGHIPYQKVFDADLTVGTQYSDVIPIALGRQIGVQVDHPATASTTYGLEVSNYPVEDARNGVASFIPWDEGVTPVEQTSQISYGWAATPPFNLARIRAVTTVAGGAGNPAQIRICLKQV